MITTAEKQAFIIAQLKPYFLNPSTCGYDPEDDTCRYITQGKMCAVGKNLINPHKASNLGDLKDIIGGEDQVKLKEEVRGKLTVTEWARVQSVHDSIVGTGTPSTMIELLEEVAQLNLQELKDLAAKLPK